MELLENSTDGTAFQQQWSCFMTVVFRYIRVDPLRHSAPWLQYMQAALVYANHCPHGHLLSVNTWDVVLDLLKLCLGDLQQSTASLSTTLPPLRLIDAAQQIRSHALPLCSIEECDLNLKARITAAVEDLSTATEELVRRSTEQMAQTVLFPVYWAQDWTSSSAVPLILGVHPSIWTAVHVCRGALQRAATVGVGSSSVKAYVEELCRLSVGAMGDILRQKVADMPAERRRQLNNDAVILIAFLRRIRGVLTTNSQYTRRLHPMALELIDVVSDRICSPLQDDEPAVSASLGASLADVEIFREHVWDPPQLTETRLLESRAHPSVLFSKELIERVSAPSPLLLSVGRLYAHSQQTLSCDPQQ